MAVKNPWVRWALAGLAFLSVGLNVFWGVRWWRAKERLSELALGKEVKLEVTGEDRFGRKTAWALSGSGRIYQKP